MAAYRLLIEWLEACPLWFFDQSLSVAIHSVLFFLRQKVMSPNLTSFILFLRAIVIRLLAFQAALPHFTIFTTIKSLLTVVTDSHLFGLHFRFTVSFDWVSNM